MSGQQVSYRAAGVMSGRWYHHVTGNRCVACYAHLILHAVRELAVRVLAHGHAGVAGEEVVLSTM